VFRINRILCPTDFSAEAQAALPITLSLARDHGAAVTLLYVRPVPMPLVGEFGTVIPDPPGPIEPLQARLRQCVPANHKGTINFCVGDGNAAEEILATAKAQQCDMIIMGTHGRSGFGRLLMGSVAEAVLRGASCPVMTIKPSKPGSAAQLAEADAEPAVNANDLVPVATAANAVDAEILRNALNAEGIRCFTEGMNQAGMTGTLGIPIKINVRATDFDRANKIIQNREACCH
jgi:nucleotide-binding universal stress UspA family protein